LKFEPFHLERYFARYEFTARYLLCCSDCDGLSLNSILNMADAETRQLWDDLHLGYTESLGHPLLREEIAALYREIQPEQCLVTAPEEGILLTMNAILDEGDHVICTFPGYQSLYQIAQNAKCEVTLWTPEEENGWRFNPDFLESHIRPNTKLLVINFPHNPTGFLPSHEDFRKIISFSESHHLYLFSDEMYRFLEYDDSNRLPAACEIYENAVSLMGMSKTFGLAGARIGWIVTRNRDLFSKIAEQKDYTTICSNAPGEILSIIVLRNKDKVISEHLERIHRNLSVLDSFLLKHSEMLDWIKPKAGTIGFPKLKTNQDSTGFCQEIIEKAGILLLPSYVYDFDTKHFRIGFGRENFPEALEQLDGYLKRRKEI
jgi:aspartate/methionine/tyrosine aminotransferase